MTTILVIDDDVDIIAMLRAVLEDEGYSVLSSDGEGALDIALAASPDLILLDLMLPGIDGAEISRQLRANPRTASIPIVLLSAARQLGQHARKMGANAMLQKPFDLDALEELIERFTRPDRRPPPCVESAPLLPNS